MKHINHFWSEKSVVTKPILKEKVTNMSQQNTQTKLIKIIKILHTKHRNLISQLVWIVASIPKDQTNKFYK